MRTPSEISRRLSTLTQALYFRSVDREELSEEGRVQLKALEDNIGLLEWCLQEPEEATLSRADVKQAFRAAAHLLWIWLFHRTQSTGSSDAAEAATDPSREVTR